MPYGLLSNRLLRPRLNLREKNCNLFAETGYKRAAHNCCVSSAYRCRLAGSVDAISILASSSEYSTPPSMPADKAPPPSVLLSLPRELSYPACESASTATDKSRQDGFEKKGHPLGYPASIGAHSSRLGAAACMLLSRVPRVSGAFLRAQTGSHGGGTQPFSR